MTKNQTRPVFHAQARVSAEDIAAAYGVSYTHFRRDMLPRLKPKRIVLSHKVHRWVWADVVEALETSQTPKAAASTSSAPRIRKPRATAPTRDDAEDWSDDRWANWTGFAKVLGGK